MPTKTRWATKAQIIKALKTEPVLKRGAFFEPRIDLIRDNERCAVCAVGAVLRALSFEKFAKKYSNDHGLPPSRLLHDMGSGLCDANYTSSDPEFLVEEKNYFGALSSYFEMGATRRRCIAFVKKHFPAKIRISASL